ncbi:protein ABSCISIC ACID-INSENSITIVE 5 [Euphorbia lathyris]|uniref:protein ABSCISIC ACID-INSENSITIVE 5 n=1 Tax=Euphorbia lathyris TaxID=212925 RepID=UPI0033139254
MVVTDSEVLSSGEVESPLQSDQHQKNNHHPFSSLGRQSSIYSLTLDEFQHTLCENGKNFGSMNMDEFLTSIWNAEENQVSNNHDQFNHGNNGGNHGGNDHVSSSARGVLISKQPSLPRQGSLSLPAPLCAKTVDEVWSEINREQPGRELGNSSNGNSTHVRNPDPSTPRQPTFGEMTLEDFLVKAGVVRQQGSAAAPSFPSQQQQFGFGTNSAAAIAAGFASKPVSGLGGGGAVGYQAMTPQGGEGSARNGGFGTQAGAAAQPVYGGRMGDGGGYAPSSMPVGGQMCPVSPDAMVNNGVNNADNQYGLDMGGLRGRKRVIDGPVEKVVERRQRRMIKNRESAARSRARKQAYTVELEAELNQLKEENNQLRHALAELEMKRKQQYLEELRMKAHGRTQKGKDNLRMMRRNLSSSF